MCTSSREYVDILGPRRAERSCLPWVTRELRPQHAFERPGGHPSPRSHKTAVLQHPRIRELIEQLSKERHVSRKQVETQIAAILDEIGYNRRWPVIRFIGYVLVKIFTRVLSGMYVNRSDVTLLKPQMGNCPVIFVPSHRSYADFIVLSYVCFNEDLAIPAIAAGMDFHGMWGMATVLRDTGAFFMRRSYNDDSLYWTTFKQYVSQIVTRGDLPIEFFIEGTRSRSGKSVMPKYGLISMILRALFMAEVPDVLFVPVNVSYDRVMEERLFAFELLGVPKPKESTWGFVKGLSIVQEHFGGVYFDFSAPISAKAFFGPALDRQAHNRMGPRHLQEITDDERRLIPALAHEIVRRQQKHCAIFAFNIVAILLDDRSATGAAPLLTSDLPALVADLRGTLEAFGAYVDAADVSEALRVHQNLVYTDEKNGELRLVANEIVLDKFDPAKLKGHALTGNTLTVAVPFVMLQLYINPVLHYLVDACAILVVLRGWKRPLAKDHLFQHYHFLRSLFSQEFVTFGQWEQTEFDQALTNCLKLDLVMVDENAAYCEGKNTELARLLRRLLDCFIYTYFVVSSVLLQSQTRQEKAILARVQSEIEDRMSSDDGAFVHPYSLTLDAILNCLNSLTARGVLKRGRSDSGVLYDFSTHELEFISDKLENYVTDRRLLARLSEGAPRPPHLRNKL